MSATTDRRRWPLTDVQRFLVVVLVVVALFLAAMALGGTSLPLFLVSVALLAVSGLTVLLIGLRHATTRHEVATAYVVAVSPPPADAIVARCDMRLRVSQHGRPPVEVKHRDVALAIERWPRVGQTLPVDVEPNSKHVKVRWDLIDQGYVRAPDPTPPRSYQPTGSSAARSEVTPSVRLHTQFRDPSRNEYDEDPAFGGDQFTVRSSPAVDPFAGALAGDGYDPHGAEALPRDADLGPTMWAGATPTGRLHPDFDPAEVDRSDFEPHSTESVEVPPPTIPMPRPAERPTLRITGPGTAVPAADDVTTGDADGGHAYEGASIGGMLIVSNLDRSLRFYSEQLDFTIVYAASSNAVVEYGGARILLQHMADFSGIDRKVGHLHIQVPDLEAAYRRPEGEGCRVQIPPEDGQPQ